MLFIHAILVLSKQTKEKCDMNKLTKEAIVLQWLKDEGNCDLRMFLWKHLDDEGLMTDEIHCIVLALEEKGFVKIRKEIVPANGMSEAIRKTEIKYYVEVLED